MRNTRLSSLFLSALICSLVACTGVASDDSSSSASAGVADSLAVDPAQQHQVESTLPVIDPVFRFGTRALALERRVEMLQWQRDTNGMYSKQWSTAQIDSSGFDPQHVNPGALPFNGERWWTSDARLDGQPVSADLLAALHAWHPFTPDLMNLPANLTASFQPDGDWLSTSQDLHNPAVGDVRLRWSILEHASPPAGIVLHEGRWELPAAVAAAASVSSSVPDVSQSSQGWLQHIFGGQVLLLAIIGAGIAALLLFLIWRRRR